MPSTSLHHICLSFSNNKSIESPFSTEPQQIQYVISSEDPLTTDHHHQGGVCSHVSLPIFPLYDDQLSIFRFQLSLTLHIPLLRRQHHHLSPSIRSHSQTPRGRHPSQRRRCLLCPLHLSILLPFYSNYILPRVTHLPNLTFTNVNTSAPGPTNNICSQTGGLFRRSLCG